MNVLAQQHSPLSYQSVSLSLLSHLLCVVSSSVHQLISCDLVVGATLGWGHPRQLDTGLRLGLTLKI